jgi:hypothetical protein
LTGLRLATVTAALLVAGVNFCPTLAADDDKPQNPIRLLGEFLGGGGVHNLAESRQRPAPQVQPPAAVVSAPP